MKPSTTIAKSKPAPKTKGGLKIRTNVKAGDDPIPGMRLNHNEKLVARR